MLPSREDNLPNTILESLACGTPVAGFDVGGVPDLVTPGETGGLARPESPESLAGVILDLLAADCGGEDWQARCRDFAEFHLPLERQAKAYRELYEQHPAVTHEHQHAAA